MPEKAIIGLFKAPYNSKKASPISGAWKHQKGGISGARKSQNVREILHPHKGSTGKENNLAGKQTE